MDSILQTTDDNQVVDDQDDATSSPANDQMNQPVIPIEEGINEPAYSRTDQLAAPTERSEVEENVDTSDSPVEPESTPESSESGEVDNGLETNTEIISDSDDSESFMEDTAF